MKAKSGTEAATKVATQVRQVGSALKKVYENLLDVSDLAEYSGQDYENRLLSRALTAQAVRMVTGFSPEEAAATVIDGHADQGIDAIAVVEGPDPHVYLVQGKWSPEGKAGADRKAVLELLGGLRLIDYEEYAPFNPRGRQLAEYAKSVMIRGPVPVTQVVVLMRSDAPGEGFMQAIANGEKEFNTYGETLGNKIILAPEVWQSVRHDQAPDPVVLTAELYPWFGMGSDELYESYQGVVDAEQVAQWARRGPNLFNLNIRNPLGRTAINNALLATLTEEPAHFWYFNNGITVLCDSVDKAEQSALSPHRKPIRLTLHNASVVNGAQTVRAVADALAQDVAAAEARIGVRIIVTNRAAHFAKETTKATNRQNSVEARDFIALDPVQAAIMDEMRAELDLEYGVRRSELDPPEQSGCSVVEAACALACAHADSQYAARIALSLDPLWERGGQGVYDVLFRPQPGVYLLWNAIQVLRQVRRSLLDIRKRYQGRGAALTEHGTYFLTHLVFRLLDTEAIGEPDPELTWAKEATERTKDLLERLVPVTMAAIDELFTERSQVRAICSDAVRSRDLAERVLALMTKADGDAGSLGTYRRVNPRRKRRRPNAVHVLVDKQVLDDGAPLTLSAGYPLEAEALRDWLAQDERRARATWVNHRTKPILWAADGKQYSPSGLITRMWELAEWAERPVANQGTARWSTMSGETLAEVAWRVLGALEEPDETDQ
ncbi:AIPR family protein [Streptomyces benahoarensis]|uniref:AIPR family protein n=1 Tax=Streptomyces benahoarensis TaxID=2595054 RepID=A0A553Z6A3_9ACTN|nr:AIPR family protein [Streptomyces benahoarensis]TSB26621.1 AIPR family protein [Streptomyces benahoarensis]TSB36976.1 AIPR family protein [Streptomyces benahoarensis]